MYFNHSFKWVALLVLLTLMLSGCIAGLPLAVETEDIAPVPKKQVDLAFANYTQANMAEQMVYVEVTPASGDVYRLTGEEVDQHLDAPLYAAGERIAPDLFQLSSNPVGPFPKGAPLGFTVQAWLAATASGTYTLAGDEAEIDLTVQNLVPDGVYTLWCSRVTMPPNHKIEDYPCGAADGSQNTFIADEQGQAEFHLALAALPESTAETVTAIALAYHSDGQTYGPEPGPFGLHTHVQIFAMLPLPEDEAWRTVSNAATDTLEVNAAEEATR